MTKQYIHIWKNDIKNDKANGINFITETDMNVDTLDKAISEYHEVESPSFPYIETLVLDFETGTFTKVDIE